MKESLKKLRARIVGTGSYLPEKVLTNSDLEKMVDTSDEWIQSRTGMKERRIAAEDEHTSDLAAKAAVKALADANVSSEDIDLILVATMSPDYISPSTAALVQAKIGARQAAAVDLGAACTGFVYGLSMAKAYIESGMYKQILFIATEKMSALLDYTDRNTCVLFGDGAAAVVVSVEGEGIAIDTVCLGAEGELANLLLVPAGAAKMPASRETVDQRMHYIKMDGKEVYKHAVRRMEQAARTCLKQAGLEEEKISWLIPHQANIRIMDAIAKQLKVPQEKVYVTLDKYGNTSGSSIGIALDELLKKHSLVQGQNLLVVAFGGGLTWGAAILTKVGS